MAARAPRLTIPTRIFLSIVLVLIFFGTASGASLYQHQRTTQRLRLLQEGYLPLATSIARAMAQQAVFEATLERLVDGRGVANARWYLDGARRIRPADLDRVMVHLRRARRLQLPSEDASALVEIEGGLTDVRAAYVESEDRFDALYDALEREDAGQAHQVGLSLKTGEATAGRRLRGTSALVQRRMDEVSRAAAEQEQQFVYLVTAMAFVALLVGLVVLWWSHRLLAPLPLLQRRVAAVARGDLDDKIAPARDDEIGQLTTEFERMVDAVAARDRQLRDAAEILRELQKMQEQIVTGLRAGVLVVDGSGVLRTTNRAAAVVLGVDAADVDRPLSELEVVGRLPALAEAIRRVAEGGERASLSAAPFGDRFVDVLVTPFGIDGGDDGRRGVLVVADDVTDEVKTKARLIQTERLAAIGRMAAHVTHEVRNPLSSIGLNVELLEEELEGVGVESKAILRSITREIDRLTEITEEYLRLARLPIPRLEPERLGDIVEEVGRFVARELETSGITLRVEVGADLPLVAADESQIRQALLNLLRNAKDAMPDGGEVGLDARAVDGGLEIRVRDRGEGIAPEAALHIFDLFYSTKDRGTGLGLPLTQQIVAAHGGTIRCQDAEGGGTVFTMWFPESRPDEGAVEVAVRHEG
ncbi:MAG: HAMP domain-containing protein [Sandaracinaceae bacterium]|nr:HAMP domain-containing protein [Sandaracinaceae bacterium]